MDGNCLGSNFEYHFVDFFLNTVSIPSFIFRYLFDNQLELEMWLSNNSNTSINEEITPTSADKYLGTAYIPLGKALYFCQLCINFD